ncbi:MAG: glutathione S-transferase [Shinella sp.]|nr:MAG: glutathione S-transferase [Shinella sp.]
MTLKLYFHPLASFCHKVLIALYENALPFEPVIVDLGNETSREAFRKVWPPLKFPVLVDEAQQVTVAESATVIDYLDSFANPARPLIPRDPDLAWQARMWDRLFDDMLQLPMQKVVLDALRPADSRDPFGVKQAKDEIRTAYAFMEERWPQNGWAVGPDFTLADCSAVPALFYADTISPLGEDFPRLRAYFQRLKQRPSVARVLREAEPYFPMFPLDPKPVL